MRDKNYQADDESSHLNNARCAGREIFHLSDLRMLIGRHVVAEFLDRGVERFDREDGADCQHDDEKLKLGDAEHERSGTGGYGARRLQSETEFLAPEHEECLE